MNAIQTIEQFKSNAASFLATVETLTNMCTVREVFAPLNAAICGNCKADRAFTIPPSQLRALCRPILAQPGWKPRFGSG